MRDDITICSVSYHSAAFLRLNERLVRGLNPDKTVRWIVAENSPGDSPLKLGAADRGFDLIDGAGPGHIPTYHHTLALRECTRRSATRFVAVMDPDLFIVRPKWVGEMLEHMQRHRLSFFGVPWHPQSLGKYRNFPAVHLTIFDTERFRREDINFLPDYPDGSSDPAWKAGWTLEGNYFARSRVARALALLPPFKARRQYYTDTGSLFYKRWVDDPGVRYDVLVPRWRAPAPHASAIQRLMTALLPDELSYIPKHYPAASYDMGPRLRASATAIPKRWECFEWRRQFFCFHVRGNLDGGDRDAGTQLDIATCLASAALAEVAGGRVPAHSVGPRTGES